MRVIALYKTFDGEEWIDASLASVYPLVDKIVMVHSEVSWLGERGNTVEMRARSFPDPQGKIIHLNHDTTCQEEQYRVGVDYIQSVLSSDLVMVVDADEIWEKQYFDSAIRQIQRHPDCKVYRVEMQTYIKTPFYQIQPTYGKPTAFFRDPYALTRSPRGCMTEGVVLQNVWMHHMTYVRATKEKVFEKVQRSAIADGNEPLYPDWDNIWNTLPNATNVHPFQRHRTVWQATRCIWLDELPDTLRNYAMSWIPEGELIHGEELVLRDLARGKDVAIDLGTSQGRSAVILSLAAKKVHTFDLFEDVFAEEVDGDIQLWQTRGHSHENVKRSLSLFSNITVNKSDTADGASSFEDETVDFVFVDANHTYDGVQRDYRAWWPKLRKGGVMVFHDCNAIHPGVVAFINTLKHTPIDLGQTCGSLKAFRK